MSSDLNTEVLVIKKSQENSGAIEVNEANVGDEECSQNCTVENIKDESIVDKDSATTYEENVNQCITGEAENIDNSNDNEKSLTNTSLTSISDITANGTDENSLNVEDISRPSLLSTESDEIQEINISLSTDKIEEFDLKLTETLESLGLTNRIQLELGAQEPWPKDVKLFQPYEVEQILLPDNANCLAVQAFLKMCNLEFQVEPRANAEAMSPSGKVPFIKAGAFVISELEPIVQFVNNKGITLTDKLDSEMKSDMRAYMSLVHNVMEVAELYICWCDKETYNEVTSIRHGSIYPWPLNHIQNRVKRASVIKKLKVLEWYQKSMTEVFQEVENCCQALTDRFEGKDYFFGDKPTELDALVFGHLFTILTTPLPNSHIANTVRNYPVLINLVQRIERDYFKRETEH